MSQQRTGALPTVVVIGAMKCGTTALHRYLDSHPQISMTGWKELNFFIGDDEPPHDRAEAWWETGQWHRGVEWYASQFDQGAPIRGESSPAYTSPDHGVAASRLADVLPDARLLYLVRDPVQRAVSQYRHHRRDGAERRPLSAALLDPESQYLSRGRYLERVRPFLERFSTARLNITVQERLLADPAGELERVYAHVGADPSWAHTGPHRRRHVAARPRPVRADLVAAIAERLEDDLSRLRSLLGDELPEWSV